jgi:protein SCO1/2
MTSAELLLIFSASAMGSFHCAAMCGGFSLSLVRPGQRGASLARMLVYHAGKLFTYVFIGLIAGTAGAALLDHPAIRGLQVAFSTVAGALIVVVGLQTLGLVPGQNIVNRLAARLWLGPLLGPIFKTFRQQTSLGGAFFIGLFNGFLPCGLVYSFALAGAGAGSPIAAMFTMLAFGLGTVPMLSAIGWGGKTLAGWQALRPALTRAAGVLVVALGAITVLRGAPLVPTFAATPLGAAHAGHDHAAPGISLERGVDLEPAPAPSFTLIDQDGQPVSLHDYHGRVVALDFIYTSCRTTCPLLTAALRAVQDGLGPDFGKRAALISITVDPATDSPEVLRAFGQTWGADFSGWTFLTGRPQDIAAVAAGYAVYIERTDDGVAHTEAIVLIDRRGQLRSVFGLRADPQAILAKAQALAREP